MLSGERIAHFETERVHKDGTRLTVSLSISPIRDASGTLVGASAIARDITARKRAEAALRESEARFRLLANTVPCFVWTTDPDGTITFANDAWFRYCGLTPEQNARNWPELGLHPDDQARCVEQWTRALREGTPYEIEVRNRRHDGEYRWFLTRAVPVRDDRGRITAWFGTTTDIHDQKQMEESLREQTAVHVTLNTALREAVVERDQALAEAQAALRVRDEFLGAISHDLRTPLTVIRGMTQLLRRQATRAATLDSARALPMLESIDGAAHKMTAMIEELLDLTYLQAGRPLALNRQPTDLVALVRAAVEEFRQNAPGHRWVIDASGILGAALVGEWDPARLDRVVANLLSNAAKYSPDGSTITLTLASETADTGTWAVLTVRDEGVGIPAADLPHIFERFYRGANVVGQVRGVGIGLAGCKHIVEQHGGTIAVTSAEGGGTTVAVRLPCAAAEPEADALAAS